MLESVALSLTRTLLSYTESIAEPTDQGYLRGYQLELASPGGESEHRLVFVEPGLPSALSPVMLGIPVCAVIPPSATM